MEIVFGCDFKKGYYFTLRRFRRLELYFYWGSGSDDMLSERQGQRTVSNTGESLFVDI